MYDQETTYRIVPSTLSMILKVAKGLLEYLILLEVSNYRIFQSMYFSLDLGLASSQNLKMLKMNIVSNDTISKRGPDRKSEGPKIQKVVCKCFIGF